MASLMAWQQRLHSHAAASCSRPAARAPASPSHRRGACTRVAACRAEVDAKAAYETCVEARARFDGVAWQTRAALRSDTTQPRRGSAARRSNLLLAARAESFYRLMNDGDIDGLDAIANANVTFSDAGAFDADYFRLSSVKRQLQHLQATHPLLRFVVDDLVTDPERGTAVAHYRATCADLLPHADGSPATGQLSEIHGRDEFSFDDQGMIRAIASFRERFMDEPAPPSDLLDDCEL